MLLHIDAVQAAVGAAHVEDDALARRVTGLDEPGMFMRAGRLPDGECALCGHGSSVV